MKNLKVNDVVYLEEELCVGNIVDIEGEIAYVEFATSGGGGCLPFQLSELKPVWCIITNIHDKKTGYLGWQNPASNKEGYFWTQKRNISNILYNNTPNHPFLFHNRKTAIRHLKTLHIPQKCKVVIF